MLGLAPTLPPKVTTKPGERKLKLFPSQGTGMAGNTVIDSKLKPSASLPMLVVYTIKPNGFDIRPAISDVRPTVNDVQPTVSDFRLTVRLLHYQLYPLAKRFAEYVSMSWASLKFLLPKLNRRRHYLFRI